MSAESLALSVKAGPKDTEWPDRLIEEYQASDDDFFQIESNDDGTIWTGECWIFLNHIKHTFRLVIHIGTSYPLSPPEIKLPELEGKTNKMYRGGIICTSDHFEPLWKRNVPRFGITHALKYGLSPWLNVEIQEILKKE